jgi:sulfite reductase alpha subunit-like flavoprotein
MGKAVREAFVEILMTQGRKKRRKEAEEHLDLMIQTNKYVQELWG